jgi:hypothetical protein
MSAPCRPAYDRGMRLIRSLLAVLVLCALAGAPAAIAKQYAPPGKAGTSEYAEDIPTGGGNTATPAMGGGNKTAAQIDKLGAGKVGVRKLTKLGTTGAAAAQFAQQTAPATDAGRAPGTQAGRVAGAGEPGGLTRGSTLSAPSGSAIGGLWHAVTGSDAGGIGIFLPLLLVLSALGAAVAGVRMRRPHSDATQP